MLCLALLVRFDDADEVRSVIESVRRQALEP
jgi:hypothetical protein